MARRGGGGLLGGYIGGVPVGFIVGAGLVWWFFIRKPAAAPTIAPDPKGWERVNNPIPKSQRTPEQQAEHELKVMEGVYLPEDMQEYYKSPPTMRTSGPFVPGEENWYIE
jgi:hypothetical protein